MNRLKMWAAWSLGFVSAAVLVYLKAPPWTYALVGLAGGMATTLLDHATTKT
jgi:hypothetical protein